MSTVSASVPKSLESFLSKPKQQLIDGNWVDAVHGGTFEVVNPANAEVVGHVAEGKADDIEAAVVAARKAFESGPWSKMTASERGKIGRAHV